MLHGVLLMALFASASFAIGDLSFVKHLSFSPMIVGIILGMLYANSLRNNLPETWVPVTITLYGDVYEVDLQVRKILTF